VIYGNLYSSHFPRYQTRIQKQGILGGQISAWTATNEYEMQKEGKLYDLFLTAQMLWSAKEIQTHLPSYDQSIRALIPQLREHLNEMRYPSRQADSSVTVLFDQSEKEVREWKNSVGMKQVNIGKAFDSLIFAHTALQKMSRLPWTNLEIIGHYLITYENQETEKVEVTYDGNIGFFGKKQNDPIKHGAYRHTGYTATYYSDGETLYTEDREPMTIYRYEYLPKKKLPVSSVEFIPNPKYGIDIFVQKLEGIHLK